MALADLFDNVQFGMVGVRGVRVGLARDSCLTVKIHTQCYR